MKYFFQRFVGKILQKHLFCISSELLLYIYFKGSNYRFSGVLFFNCCLAAPRPTLGHSQGDSLTKSMSITAFKLFPPEGHREPILKTYFKNSYFDTSISNYLYINRIIRVFLALVLHVQSKQLVSTSYGLIIEFSRNEKLQNYRFILSRHTNYTNDWSPF